MLSAYVCMGRPYVYVPQAGSIINLKIGNCKKKKKEKKALPVS